jgi:hypothetical protein
MMDFLSEKAKFISLWANAPQWIARDSARGEKAKLMMFCSGATHHNGFSVGKS